MKFSLRKAALVCVDLVTLFLACMASMFVLNKFTPRIIIPFMDNMPVIAAFIGCSLIGMGGAKVYSNVWRFAHLKDFFRCLAGVTAGVIVAFFILALAGKQFSKIFMMLSYSLGLCGIMVIRTMYSWFYSTKRMHNALPENTSNTLIVGAGNAAFRIISEIKESPCGYNVVCAVDDNASKRNREIRGVPILGTIEDIPRICKEKNIKDIIIAIPSSSEEERSHIVEVCQKTDCAIKTLPYIHELLDMESLVKQAHNIRVEDLLGRGVVRFDNTEVKKLISGKICMVTGGGGSIGSELCRQIAKYHPKKLVIVDIYENNAYDIQQELNRSNHGEYELCTEIASVRDYNKMDKLFKQYRPHMVFHAAAHKHVPLMETNPEEAVKNNILGTFNVANLAELYKVENFVLISTDKAVNPTNVMGATKRCCEMIVQIVSQSAKYTKFNAVRFGNVLGSNGSVIPLFERQIAEGGPVTVTDPEIIRYFMTIPEAVALILQSATLAKGGEIFVLDMGKPVKILTLAENLIRMHGKKPYTEIPIEFTGLRPGEKLYEELLMDEEGLKKTDNKKIFIGKPIDVNEDKLMEMLKKLEDSAKANDKTAVVDALKEVVPTFNHKTND